MSAQQVGRRSSIPPSTRVRPRLRDQAARRTPWTTSRRPTSSSDQPDLAVKVCKAVRADLALRDPPLNYIQALRYFERKADVAWLSLPFKYASILAFNDEVDEVVNWYGDMMKEPSNAHRPLLYRVRALMRSERFEYAPRVQVAQVSLVWGLVEEQYGTMKGALMAYEWCLGKVVGEHADAGIQELGEKMKKRIKLINDWLAIGPSADEVENAGTATAAADAAEETQPNETKLKTAKETSSTV